MSINKYAFETAKIKIIGVDRQRLGIGTLSEKTVHAILKNYYQPDEDHQEIPIENFVADIYADGEIMEIQTRQFDRLRRKLDAFLPLYPVTIVCPVPRNKWLIWIDEENGELSKKRKSPKTGTEYDAFRELYKIKMYLKHPGLRIKIVMMDIEEYRLLNGWSRDKKKGSSRYDRIPTELVSETDITCLQDYMQFVPYEIKEPFTVKDFAKEVHISPSDAGTVINILAYTGVIEQTGKQGRAYLYRVKD